MAVTSAVPVEVPESAVAVVVPDVFVDELVVLVEVEVPDVFVDELVVLVEVEVPDVFVDELVVLVGVDVPDVFVDELVVLVVVQEFILTLKEVDSLSPVYPLTADICT